MLPVAMADRPKVTIATLRSRKQAGEKIAMLTCYDWATARLLEQAGVDCLLVGDSYGQVVLGFDSTLPVTVDQMLTVTAAVRRGAPSVYLVGDMPYLSYQIAPDQAVRNAGRFMAEAGCDCVKIEADRRYLATVEAMSRAMIPVMAHLGLRPQSIHQTGGYRSQGTTADAARLLIEDARVMAEAGACALLLEAVPPEPARIVAESTELPVIGCGAGPFCDGHVLVLPDMLGLTTGQVPRFVKCYGQLAKAVSRAAADYVADVRQGRYPADEHVYRMKPGEADKLR